MLNKKKIAIVVNSRANYARIKSVLIEINKSKQFKLQLIVGASALLNKFGNLENIIKKDKLSISAKIYSIIEGENLTTMAKSTGLGIIELSTIFQNLKPDIALTIADRFETMATAIVASYTNILLVHTQGGEITGSIDESVRHAITKLSHIHFPSTKNAAQNIIKMGENRKNVFLTGCPSIDIAKKISKKKNFKEFKEGIGASINLREKYIIVMHHPVTTEFTSTEIQIREVIKAISEINIQTIWFWPNIDAGSDTISKMLRVYREKNFLKKVRFCKNLPPEDFLILANYASCLVGNSSIAIREGSYLGIPSVNIGNRQSGREHGKNILHCGHEKKKIISLINRQIKHGKYKKETIFGKGNSAKLIKKILTKVKISIQKKLFYEK